MTSSSNSMRISNEPSSNSNFLCFQCKKPVPLSTSTEIHKYEGLDIPVTHLVHICKDCKCEYQSSDHTQETIRQITKALKRLTGPEIRAHRLAQGETLVGMAERLKFEPSYLEAIEDCRSLPSKFDDLLIREQLGRLGKPMAEPIWDRIPKIQTALNELFPVLDTMTDEVKLLERDLQKMGAGVVKVEHKIGDEFTLTYARTKNGLFRFLINGENWDNLSKGDRVTVYQELPTFLDKMHEAIIELKSRHQDASRPTIKDTGSGPIAKRIRAVRDPEE